MRSRFSKENATSKLAMLQILISRFQRCFLYRNFAPTNRPCENFAMALSPQTAESLRFAAVSDELPIKIGRRSMLPFKEKEAKTENGISISLDVPMGKYQ